MIKGKKGEWREGEDINMFAKTLLVSRKTESLISIVRWDFKEEILQDIIFYFFGDGGGGVPFFYKYERCK